MKMLIERILGAGINRWPLQIIQHCLALHSYVPLRIWDWDTKVERKLAFGREGLESNWVGELSNGTGLDSMPPLLVEDYADRNNTRWLTITCNRLPLEDYLRREKRWRGWQNYAVGKWLQDPRLCAYGCGDLCQESLPSDPELYVQDFVTDGMKIVAYPLRVPEGSRRFLVVGPLFLLPEKSLDERTVCNDSTDARFPDTKPPGSENHDGDRQSEFEKLVLSFVERIQKHIPDSGNVNALRGEDMRLEGGARGWIRQNCLCKKAFVLGQTLDAIFRIECEALPEDFIIRNSAYSSLARLVYLLHQELAAKDNPRAEFAHLKEVSFEVDHRRGHELRLTATRRTDEWELALRKPTADEVPRVVVSLNPGHEGTAKDVQDTVTWLRDETGLAFSNQYHGYSTYRLTLLSRWLNEKFDVVSEDEATSNHDLLDLLTKRILQLTMADIVTIFVYNHYEGSLIAEHVRFQQKYGSEQETVWRELEKELMIRASENPVKSISYRAVRKGNARFCRSWNVAPEKCDPSGEEVLNPSDELFAEVLEHLKTKHKWPEDRTSRIGKYVRNSAMAMPLIVRGLFYGVLEIDGFCPHQFRFDTFLLAQHIADIVGPFLYQRDILTRLFGLSNFVLNPARTASEKYDKICREMAHIFMAEAAILFVPSADDWKLYDLVGVFNLPRIEDLDSSKKQDLRKADQELFSEEPDKAGVAYAAQTSHNTRRLFRCYDIEDKLKDPEWTGPRALPHRKAIIAKYGEGGMGMVIPVMNPTKSMKLCRLSLYYGTYKPLSDEWNATVHFVTYYLVMLVMTIRGLTPLTQLLEDPGLQEALSRDKEMEGGLERAHAELRIIGDGFNRGLQGKPSRGEKIKHLHDEYMKRKLVVVLGAGASKAYGIPDWNGLLQQVLIRSFGHQTRVYGWIYNLVLRLLSGFLAKKHPLVSARHLRARYKQCPAKFVADVREVIYDSVAKNEQEYPRNAFLRELADLWPSKPDTHQGPRRGSRSNISPGLDSVITLNYDDLLEWTLTTHGNTKKREPYHSIYLRELPQEISGIPIYHVHGYLPETGTVGTENMLTLLFFTLD